ncbi:MAG: alanine--tRNA ligase [Alphaproteobacteria bacterium]|jgi:alanyl-tRNA synthetase
MIRSISSQEVINIFLNFFEQKKHLRIPGHSVVPDNDPSLLFINSGMAPLKTYFLGQERPPQRELCNIQRCVRTNDIEEVGDRHHLTFFEMMGSWSIGGYWKEEAIALAWELLTKHFGFPPESLYATVYRGDPERGIPGDDESVGIWERVGLAPDHIVPLGVDNFWGPAGEFGPCGPCTEVFYDTGDAFGERYVPGGHFDDVNRYIEIWNAGVFMQYNKLPTGLTPLEMRSVDTGSGVERMLMTLNGVETVYETDLLSPLVDFAAAHLDLPTSDRAVRLISDHVRAATMILADRVKPAASGPGYIPRRLIRRAVAAARQRAPGFDFAAMVEIAIGNVGVWNAHVAEQRDEIKAVFAREQEVFEATLTAGLGKLEDAFAKGATHLDGATAFKLFATYGLPVDTLREYALTRAGSFDEDGFNAAFAEHQELSRAVKDQETAAGAAAAMEHLPQTEFVGYADRETDGTVLGLFRQGEFIENAEAGAEIVLVVDRTPFYAEGGGQVGDRGLVTADGLTFEVRDTNQGAPGVFAHYGTVREGSVRKGQRVHLTVDSAHRERVQANHSATHLLHAALRKVLGSSVGQAGSRVDGDRLRFDFTYGEKVSDEALARVEDIVNVAILANLPQSGRTMAFDDAVGLGALAFFGDKYGAEVRTVAFGDVSIELCGGTHVGATGEIGPFVILSESSVARGVRRIQAVTGLQAYHLLRDHGRLLQRVAAKLNARPDDLETRVEALLARQKAAASTPASAAAASPEALAATAAPLADGTPGVVQKVDAPAKALRGLAIDTARAIGGVAVLAAEAEGRVSVTVAVHAAVIPPWHASELLKRLLPAIEGSGGGKDTLAAGAGEKATGLDDLLAQARTLAPAMP